MPRPNPHLLCQVESTTGQVDNYSPASREPWRIPEAMEFSTKFGTGFESGSFTLRRNVLNEYPSDLLKTVRYVGAGGFVAYEGRHSGAPKSTDRGVEMQSVGWYSHTRDNPSPEVYKDQDVSNWGPMPVARQAQYLTNNYSPTDGQVNDAQIKLILASPPWTNPGFPSSEMWYIAPPGVSIATLSGTGTVRNDPGASRYAKLSSTDSDLSADFAVASGAFTVTATGVRRYAFFQFDYGGTSVTADSTERSLTIASPTVIGTHGLTNIYASEVIKNAIDRWCPMLRYTSESIQDTTTAVAQAVFGPDSRPEDIILKFNGLHLFEPAVWEDRTFWWLPSRPLDDYDWEMSLARGDDFAGTGEQVDDDGPYNGVWVIYTNVLTGREERLGPLGTAAGMDSAGSDLLRDDDPENPCNREGFTRHAILQISDRTDAANATTMGAVFLQEHATPNRQGTGRTATPYVKDRSGAWQPAYKMRAGERVKYTHEETIRRIHGTRYSTVDKTADLEFDNLPFTLDAILERMGIALVGIRG